MSNIGLIPVHFRLSYIYPEEWQVLSRSFSVETAIEVIRTKAPDGTYSFTVTPGKFQMSQDTLAWMVPFTPHSTLIVMRGFY